MQLDRLILSLKHKKLQMTGAPLVVRKLPGK
jgi:hypothetical protein